MPNEKPDSFQIGSFEVVRNPDPRQLTEKLNRLREAVDQCRIQPGVGYTVSRSSGGTVLSFQSGRGGVSVQPTHPFRVTLLSRPQGYFFTVEPVSYANFTGDAQIDTQISNLLSEIPLNTRELAEDYFAVLRYDVSKDLQPSNVRLEAIRRGDWRGAVLPERSDQTEGNLILATITRDLRVVQAIKNHLVIALVNYLGRPAILPIELYSGGVPDSVVFQ